MKPITDFSDIHTHRPDAGKNAVICLPRLAPVPVSGYYSAGIHPWDTDTAAEADFIWLAKAAALDNVVAIGETGLDALRGAPLQVQEEIFRRHIDISEACRKPLIIHAVRTINRIIELCRDIRPQSRWIIHGFRGKPEQARQLLHAGIDISLGAKYNPRVPEIVPAGHLFHETD